MDLVSEYVTLKRAGSRYKGLCPFHPEKTPSFHVHKDKQLFYCFGCHAGGDAFTFIMKMEGLTFPEAIERLAKRSGVSLQKGTGSHTESNPGEKQQIFEVNNSANAYFQMQLRKEGSGFKYLKSRGLGEEIIREFELGYAPAAWDSLLLYLRNSYSVQLILKAGLICQRQNGKGYYDRFRNRVIFPIRNLYGDICGFGGRLIDSSGDGPKYLNSPDTPAYSKGQILYGLYKAKNAITQMKQAIIVEGYLDLLTLFNAGFRNVVATLGTALTINQIRILKRYTNEVVLLFDADIAGQNAAQRGIDLFLEQGIKVKVAILPSGKDPDSFVRQEGKEKFARVIDESQPFIDYLLSTFNLTGEIPIQEKAQNAEKIIPFLTKMKDPIELAGYIDYVAQKAKIPEDALRMRIKQISGPKKKALAGKGQPPLNPQEMYSHNNRRSAERLLIQLALDAGEPSQTILQNVNEEDFKDPELRALAGIIFDHWRRGISVDPKYFLMEITDEKHKETVSRLVIANESFEDSKQAIWDCIKRLQQEKIFERLKNIKQEIDSGLLSDSEINLLLCEYHRLKTECICM